MTREVTFQLSTVDDPPGPKTPRCPERQAVGQPPTLLSVAMLLGYTDSERQMSAFCGGDCVVSRSVSGWWWASQFGFFLMPGLGGRLWIQDVV